MRIVITSLLLSCVWIGCRQPANDQGITELETVEVGAAPDAELSTELDEQAKRIVVESSGVLPTDIPLDVPIYSPASLVDFGKAAENRNFVAVDTSAAVARVRDQVTSELTASGWKIDSASDSNLEFGKDGAALTVLLEDLKQGTRLRYEYTPR